MECKVWLHCNWSLGIHNSLHCVLLIYSLYRCFMIAFKNIRYLLILDLNFQKSEKFQENSVKMIPMQYRIYKKLSSTYTLLMLTIVSFFGIFSTHFIVILFHGFKCKNSISMILRLIHTFLIVSVILVNIGIFIIDIILNFKKLIKCKLYRYFIFSDPHYFRFEQILLLFIVMILIVWVSMSGSPFFFKLLVTEFLLFYLLHIGGVFSLYVTIFLCIYYKLKKSNNSHHASNLENIFNDEELFQMFKEYSKSEWSIENVFCKVDINKYKSLNSPKKRKILSEFICTQYLNSDFSPFEVNVDTKAIAQVTNLVQNSDKTPLERDLFKEVEQVVDSNLLDTFSRFQFTKKYVHYVQKRRGLSFVLQTDELSV
jgi:hypothetical protein